MFNRCRCPQGRYLEGNECKLSKVCSPGYVRLYNNTCIKKCPDNQIDEGNTCRDVHQKQGKMNCLILA